MSGRTTLSHGTSVGSAGARTLDMRETISPGSRDKVETCAAMSPARSPRPDRSLLRFIPVNHHHHLKIVRDILAIAD